MESERRTGGKQAFRHRATQEGRKQEKEKTRCAFTTFGPLLVRDDVLESLESSERPMRYSIKSVEKSNADSLGPHARTRDAALLAGKK